MFKNKLVKSYNHTNSPRYTSRNILSWCDACTCLIILKTHKDSKRNHAKSDCIKDHIEIVIVEDHITLHHIRLDHIMLDHIAIRYSIT